MATPILTLQDVHTYYGNIHALKGISLTVNAGEIVTLIGSNGAGKSTTLRTISGIINPRQGQISFNDTRIDRMPAHEIVRLGVLQSPEGRRNYATAEKDAAAARLGLWQDAEPVPPWEWRHPAKASP